MSCVSIGISPVPVISLEAIIVLVISVSSEYNRPVHIFVPAKPTTNSLLHVRPQGNPQRVQKVYYNILLTCFGSVSFSISSTGKYSMQTASFACNS